MDTHLLKKKWAIPLLLIGLLFSSCINKDYDLDNLDDTMVLQDIPMGFPLGTINYSALDIAKKANFGYDIVAEGDTLFLRYYRELEFSASPGDNNFGTLPINVFRDIEEGSVLYFSNPIFNCKVENKSNTPITFNINSIRGMKENYPDIPFRFDGNDNFSTLIPENKTVTRRFDRIYGETNKVFIIGNSATTGVGPDIIAYDYSHTALNNHDMFADITAKLPLSFDKDSRIIFRDTLSMNLASYKEDYKDYEDYVEYIEITIPYINKMPVGGLVDFVFLDENNLSVTGLDARRSKLNKPDLKSVQMQGFTSNITQREKRDTMYIIFEKSDWEAAKNIKSMIIKSTLTNPENIHILPSDFLQFKVTFYLRGNIKLN
jgi:hypothetical protein